MRRDHLMREKARQPLITRRRFQLAGALLFGALLPYFLRTFTAPDLNIQGLWSSNAFVANFVAIVLALWIRLSIETYPGIRSSYVIFPVALAAHGVTLLFFVLTQVPYDRSLLTSGFALHVLWNYFVYLYGERRIRRRIAIVPFGGTQALREIDLVEWKTMKRPRLSDVSNCHAIVADFSAELPPEWEAFLADAALAGRIVYQVKQLSESLTGRVELTHLSENSFGSLVPARGYFHLKTALDALFALAVLPFALPVLAVSAIAIRLENTGPIFFRQARVGHAGRMITVTKFRTMRAVASDDPRQAAITLANDDRITRVGAFLRRTRIDELPQILNVLKLEMSWIGPRPEAEILSLWYTGELPFYRYRHVVKPGISGWAQVNQGHVAEVEDVHRKLQYDFYYIKYFSPWLDLLIVLRTVKTMLTGFGSR